MARWLSQVWMARFRSATGYQQKVPTTTSNPPAGRDHFTHKNAGSGSSYAREFAYRLGKMICSCLVQLNKVHKLDLGVDRIRVRG
jgi:hypothetical protein